MKKENAESIEKRICFIHFNQWHAYVCSISLYSLLTLSLSLFPKTKQTIIINQAQTVKSYHYQQNETDKKQNKSKIKNKTKTARALSILLNSFFEQNQQPR